MSRLNGFVKCRASSYVQWGVYIYISGTEHNMTLKFSMLTFLTHEYLIGILPCFSEHRSIM